MIEPISNEANEYVEIVEEVKEDLFDDFDPETTEPLDRAPIIDHPFIDPEGEPIGDLP